MFLNEGNDPNEAIQCQTGRSRGYHFRVCYVVFVVYDYNYHCVEVSLSCRDTNAA